mgnify:CR=1 FL=1
MIPDLPEGLTPRQQLDFYEKLLATNEGQGLQHINWHTHRQNPSLCWICDRHTLCLKMLSINEELISKSTVDSETSSVHDSEEDSEIENDSFDADDYNEPEYDVEDELQSEDSEG